MWVSGTLLILTSLTIVPSASPKTVLSSPWTTTFLTQLSDCGFNVILPENTTMLNGLTFSILDAKGWFNNSTSS